MRSATSLSVLLATTLLVVPVHQRAGWAGQTLSAPSWEASITDVTRIESWRYFEPAPGGGDPDYGFLGNRLRLQGRLLWPRARVTVAAQHVGFLGLPDDAVGPGALGTGALYYLQGGRQTRPQQLYLRYAHVELPGVLPGLDLQVGRMAYANGTEAPSGVPKIEAVKGARLMSRIVGEFEWSLYQRGFDGVRLDLTRPAWKLTGVAVMPSQGGFARVAGPTMTDLVVSGVTVSSRPRSGASRPTQVQAFGYYQADHRQVTERPDNTGRVAAAADIDLTTIGGTVVGTYRAGRGEIDLFGWVAVQRGDWYEQTHSAFALDGEAGYQWTGAPWRPWVRAGILHASGDDDAADARHETFFPMLPTVRRYSQTTLYSTMNLRDLFVQLRAQPRPALGVALDLHRLDLASAADRWYAGSGATLNRGGVFGYAGRPSRGQRRLGTSVEFSANYAVRPGWSANGFLALMSAGPVVTGTFAGDRAWFAYIEQALSFDVGR